MTPRTPRRRTARAASTRPPVASEPAAPTPIPAGLELVEVRKLLSTSLEARIPLAPGDLVLVEPGARFASGDGLAEILRDARTVETASRSGHDGATEVRPGDRWTGPIAGRRRRGRAGEEIQGEALYALEGRWRVAAGEVVDRIEAPGPGVVGEIRPGSEMMLRFDGRALPGGAAFGTPVRGRLEIAARPDGEIRAGAIDVRQRGTILVVGARVDAEALTRARAMGVRGVVVAGLAGKERRDLLASGERQQAGRHRLEPFAILVLDGTLRRPIAAAQMDVLRALAGAEVAILVDPPALLLDASTDLPVPVPAAVRVKGGPRVGEEGTWAGLAGIRRFAAGVQCEAARVTLGDGSTAIVPLADLERFA